MFDENKAETRIPIDHVTDIYRHADVLRMSVVRYLAKPAEPGEPAEPAELAEAELAPR